MSVVVSDDAHDVVLQSNSKEMDELRGGGGGAADTGLCGGLLRSGGAGKRCEAFGVEGDGENFGELCKHFGSRRVMLPSRHLIKGQRHGDEGQVSVGEKWLVDPDRVRQFETGDFVFAKKGRAFYGRIVPLDTKRLTPLPGTAAAKKTATQPG
ncbi:hypothetical protein, partial [Nocardia sp. 852002-51244_SCH5132740]|uniref:hypothetical protein n=1 Tax=Nocardia sp. 852002-51244_SCH5132740 TaxID=1834099 RepID=UPI001E430CD2